MNIFAQGTPALAPACIPSVVCADERCMCCWYVLHPTLPYPQAWSSTLCAGHVAWYKATRQHAKERGGS